MQKNYVKKMNPLSTLRALSTHVEDAKIFLVLQKHKKWNKSHYKVKKIHLSRNDFSKTFLTLFTHPS